MSLLEQKARETAFYLNAKKGVPNLQAFDPATILMLIQVISAIISLWKSCKKNPVEALDTIENPGILGEARLRWIIARQAGLFKFTTQASIREALREVGKKITYGEMVSLYNEVAD